MKCNNKCRSRLEKSPIVEKLPKEITKFIQKQKKEITNYLFYSMYQHCWDKETDKKNVPLKKCPHCICNKTFKKHKISFNSNKKRLNLEMIPPKGSNYKDIEKSIQHLISGIWYGKVELGIDELDLYKIKNHYYLLDWKFKNMVIPDYYKK